MSWLRTIVTDTVATIEPYRANLSTAVSHATSQLSQTSASLSQYRPRVNMFETPEKYIYLIDIPGVTREAIIVNEQNGNLIITGKRENPADNATQTMMSTRYTESIFSEFKRSITLEPDAIAANLTADVTDGVLTIIVERSINQVPVQRTIDIQ